MTAIDALGMMWDITEEVACTLGALSSSTDIVGSWEIDNKAE